MTGTGGTIVYASNLSETRTVEIPATDFTAAHPDLIQALLAFPFEDPRDVPEVLYSVVEELAAGRALAPRAVVAAEFALELREEAPDWAAGFCPSCFHAVRYHDDWSEDEPDEGVLDGLAWRWRGGGGSGGRNTCIACRRSPGAMRGIATTGPVGPFGLRMASGLPRYMVHPSDWFARGFVPDEQGGPGTPWMPPADPPVEPPTGLPADQAEIGASADGGQEADVPGDACRYCGKRLFWDGQWYRDAVGQDTSCNALFDALVAGGLDTLDGLYLHAKIHTAR